MTHTSNLRIIMAAIVPKKDARGVDFCGVVDYYCIVRSDINCYMSSTNFNKGDDLNIFSLHPACSNGDHYVAHEDGGFYIIKGTDYRRVTNLNRDDDSSVGSLHPSCQGGDHYLSAFGKFYIVYQTQGVYRITKNLATYEDGSESSLHPNWKDGLYYFGTKYFCYCMKPKNEWGIQYYRCTNFNTNEEEKTFSFHPSIISFLPGGMGLIRGPSSGAWKCLKTIKNDSQAIITWVNKISVTRGYTKEKMSSIEHNWNISASMSLETGALTALLVKMQVSLSASYGGSSIQTNRESWTTTTVTEETINLQLQPNQAVYVYQYQLSLGEEPVLFCRDLKFKGDPSPPTKNPFSI